MVLVLFKNDNPVTHIIQWKKYEEYFSHIFLMQLQNMVNISAKTYTVPNLQMTLLCACFCSVGRLQAV